MPRSSPGMTRQYADLRVHKLVLSISQRREVVRDRSALPPSQTPRLSSISITARKAWQCPLDCFPYNLGRNVFVIVAIDVSRTSHLLPADRGMPRFYFIRQAARSFGNDLQASRDGVYGLDVELEGGAVEPRREFRSEGEVMRDIARGGAYRFTRNSSVGPLRRGGCRLESVVV